MKTVDSDYYSCDEHCEQLSHTDPDEAIEYWLDSIWPWKLDELPETVTVYKFTRRELDPADVRSLDPLDNLLERLDEEYGGDGPSEPTERMKEAERKFIEAVTSEYVPWQCERSGEEEIDVMDWIKKNNPDWLSDEGLSEPIPF